MHRPVDFHSGPDEIWGMTVSPLRQYRIEKGWGLKQAAKHLGVSISHLSDLETGKSKPSVSTAARLAKKTGLSTMSLLGLEDAA